jgi:hypothetical protein
VCKQIFAAIIGSDKTETLRVVEPFNSTSCHVFTSLPKNGELPAELFETKTAHGNTSTADTLNQTPAHFVLQFVRYRQGVYGLISNGLEKAAAIINYVT